MLDRSKRGFEQIELPVQRLSFARAIREGRGLSSWSAVEGWTQEVQLPSSNAIRSDLLRSRILVTSAVTLVYIESSSDTQLQYNYVGRTFRVS
jgi:hypothetical protein